MLRAISILAVLAAAATCVASPTTAPAGCPTEPYRQLDFWLGDWDAFDYGEDTAPIARTRVTLIAAGCALHELYEQTDGLIGDSILSYDAARRLWQQTWVTNRGSLLAIAGPFKNGTLTMEGQMHASDGRSIQQRITWTLEGNAVRESSWVSKDEGKTWTPAFDVLFRRRQ